MNARDLEGFVGVDRWLTNTDRDDVGRGGSRGDRSHVAYSVCAHCHQDAVYPVTRAGVGVFCSTRCADAAQRATRGAA